MMLELSKEDNNDLVVEHDGSKILIIERQIVAFFDNAILDVQNTADGPKLFFAMSRN